VVYLGALFKLEEVARKVQEKMSWWSMSSFIVDKGIFNTFYKHQRWESGI